jgi:hypothetical protein
MSVAAPPSSPRQSAVCELDRRDAVMGDDYGDAGVLNFCRLVCDSEIWISFLYFVVVMGARSSKKKSSWAEPNHNNGF